MDAISFVLGIKSSHLRSTNLKDLVYRGRVLRTSKVDVNGEPIVNGENVEQEEEDEDEAAALAGPLQFTDEELR